MASSEEQGAVSGAQAHVEAPTAELSSPAPEAVSAEMLPSDQAAGEQPAASGRTADSDDEEDDDRRKRVPAGEDEVPRQALRTTAGLPPSSTSGGGSIKPPEQQVSSSTAAARAASSKYFIMKSINHDNISKSVAEGIWATQMHNETKLNEAFRTVGHVYLIFSINGSGAFQGFARMTSPAMKQARSNSWAGFDGNAFSIQWQRVFDMQFHATEHLRNPLNENKPVKICRDGQELPSDVGEQMVKLFIKLADAAGVGPPPPPQRSCFRPGVPPVGRDVAQRAGGFRPQMSIADPHAMVFDGMGRPIGNVNSLMRSGPPMGGWRPDGMNGPSGMGMMMGPGPGFGNLGGRGGMMGPRGPPAMNGGGGGMGAHFGYDREMMPQMFQRQRSPVPRRPPPPSSRSRSRSPSPRRRRRRSRSRSRSPDRGRSAKQEPAAVEAPNLLKMSYDEYLEYFERMRRQRAAGLPGPTPPAGPPPAQPSTMGRLSGGLAMPAGSSFMGMPGMGMSGMAPMIGMGMGMGMNTGMGMGMMGGLNSGMNMGFGGMGSNMGAATLMSEEEYIRTCEDHAGKMGMNISRQQIKQHYQTIVSQMMMGR